MKKIWFFIPVLAIWAGFVVLLAYVPWVGEQSRTDTNIADILGYDISLAYLLVAGWSVVCILLGALLFRDLPVSDGNISQESRPRPGMKRRLIELMIVLIAAAVLYWPGALAKMGPWIEDEYFLNVLWRMACGAEPYTDFEFLYGPLMVYPLAGWTEWVGLSMQSYYSFYVAAQVSLLVILCLVFQATITHAVRRYLAILLFAPFVMDILLGMNWIAWRYIGVVFVLLLLSRSPLAWPSLVLAALVTGAQAAYSYEYGIAAMLAGLTAIGMSFFEGRLRASAAGAAGYILGSVVAWAGLAATLTGDAFGDYITMTRLVASVASEQGLGKFAFFWTGQSLALFLVLALALALAAVSLNRLGRVAATPADRFLAGALVFGLVSLKIALQRADFVHLAPPFIPLVIAFLMDGPRRVASTPASVRLFATVCIAVAAASHSVALAPWAQWIVKDQVAGWKQIARGDEGVLPFAARKQSLYVGRAYINDVFVDLAGLLARPEYAERPVLFYRQTWDLPPVVGVCPEGYAYYDLLYSDARAPHKTLVANSDDVLVVMHLTDFDALSQPRIEAEAKLRDLNGLRRIAQLVGSSHFAQSHIENGAIESNIWRDAVGDDIVQQFQPLHTVGAFVVLGRTAE